MRPFLPAVVIPVLLAACASAQEWTRFRGANGDGISPATTIPVRWTEKDHNWKVVLPGVGHSSPVLWGERIFVTCGEEKTGKRLLLCLRASDGKELWRREFTGEVHRKHSDNSFASATPVVDERHVYATWGGPKDYLVVALNHDGKEAWRVDLGPYRGGHGFGASPIVYEDVLVVPNDQDGPSALIGLDRGTGKIRWQVPRKGESTYITPCLYRPKDRPAELIFTNWDHGITALDPRTGKIHWEANVFDKGHTESAIGSPVVAGDLILGTCGWLGVRQEVVALRPDAEGQMKEVYRIARSAPLCTTPLVKDDLLFLWSDGGIVTCAEAKTGAVHWRERVPGAYYSSPVWVAGRLYNISREGEVVVLAAARKFEQLGRIELGEGSHATPAIAGGRMYLRTFTQLMSIGGTKASP
jgi:outer membrane protein assembly factor BamB